MTRWASLVLFVAATVLLLGLPDGGARAQSTTASITGTILDENEQPLPGVNVVAVHQPTGTRYGVASAPNGTYTIQGMRVGGPYTVTASFVGYQTIRRTGISLQLNETQEINFQLQPKTTEMAEIEVVGERTQSATISKSRTGARANISSEEIEELPTIQRSLQDFARLIPQFTGTDGQNIAGRNQRYNTVQIDGATLNDVFGLQGSGGVPGGQAGTQPISLDAIKEFNVEISPYDVQQSGFTGGRINAITKSGSNQFEGSFRYLGRDQTFIGDLNGEEFGTDFGEHYFVGTLGGPIIRDELFFFVNAEIFRRGEPLDTRVGTDVDATNVFPAGQSTMERIRNIAQNQYDYDPGGFSPLTERQDNQKVLAKLDWNMLDNHRLTLRHNFVNAYNETGLTRFNSAFDFANQQYRFESLQNSTSLELSSRFGDSWFNEFRFVYTRIRDNRDPQGGLFPAVNLQLGNVGSVGLGVGGIEQANRLDQDLFEISNNLTYQLGDHTLEFGTQNEVFIFNNLFIPDLVGSYEFSQFEVGDSTVTAIEAFERGQPTSYSHTYANPAVHGDNYRPEPKFTGMQFGLYAQDKWDITEQLRLTLGLRVDVPYLPDDPSYNPAVEEAFGFSTSEVPETQPLWSPRLGFNYSETLLGDEIETQVRGGTGIFSGRPPFVWLSNQYSSTGVDFFQVNQSISPGGAYVNEDGIYDRSESCFAGTSQPEEAPKPTGVDLPGAGACGDILGAQQTAQIALTDPDFKYPQQFRASFGIDQELPFGNLVATLEGQYSTTINGVSARNLNIESPESGLQESAYGRPLYGPESSVGGGFGGANRVDDQFQDVILLENANEGYEYFLTAELSREAATGLNWTVAYNYNRARSIFNGSFDVASSLWQQNFAVDPNDPGLGTAEYEGRHRVLVTGNYRFSWGDLLSEERDLTTTIGAFFETRSGQPITWIHGSNASNFGTDANADGFPFNDLPYVPENEREVVVASGNWELMDDFISSVDALDDARGGFVNRYTDRAPWRTIFDLKVTQRIETLDDQRLEFIANLENVLNLINDEWGRIRFTPFNNQFAWGLNGYVRPGDVGSRMGGRIITQDDIGKPIVNFEEDLVRDQLGDRLYSTANTASRWQLQLGVRYVF